MPKRRRPEFIPADPNSPDQNVKLPRQARVALERAEALVAGRPPRPVAVDAASLTNAQIDAVLARLDQGKLSVSDPDPGAVLALIREGARRIKADRQKAQTPKAQAAQKAKDAAIKQRLNDGNTDDQAAGQGRQQKAGRFGAGDRGYDQTRYSRASSFSEGGAGGANKDSQVGTGRAGTTSQCCYGHARSV